MIGHLLLDSADVYRATTASDGRGGRTESRSKVSTVRVKVGQPTAAEVEVAARDGARLTHVVHAEYGAGVTRNDLLSVGGVWLRVIGAVTNSRRSYLRINCEVYQHG